MNLEKLAFDTLTRLNEKNQELAAMNFELRNIKHSAFASHETHCFEATVYIDGKRAGTVRNDGHGGPDDWHPWELKARVDAYASTLPAIVEAGGTHVEAFLRDAEFLVCEKVNEYLAARELSRKMARNLVFHHAGQVWCITHAKHANLRPKQKALVLDRYPGAVILNDLPRDEAIALYRRAA